MHAYVGHTLILPKTCRQVQKYDKAMTCTQNGSSQNILRLTL